MMDEKAVKREKTSTVRERGISMLGAIAGDVIGSVYEGRPIKTKKFDLFQDKSTFTDDSVLTAAVASALMTGESVASTLRSWYFRYP
ncbi:MAG: hypothetical protein HQL80_13735, partial [Magnetococcales bacterium]|nr:hypothetical protein [Magnetococcales bacterium]